MPPYLPLKPVFPLAFHSAVNDIAERPPPRSSHHLFSLFTPRIALEIHFQWCPHHLNPGWLEQLSCCLVSLPGLTCPLPAPPQFILFVAWIFPKCTPGRVTFLGRHRQVNTWGALDRCHQRPHQLHLLPSFLSLNLPPHRRALSLCRGRSFCLDPSLQCLPPLSS